MLLAGDIDGTKLLSPLLMSRDTGKPISDIDHLKQSIVDILTTPLGSRVMRRNYGSNLFFLIDRPISGGLILQMTAATVQALSKWEPRLYISRATFDTSQASKGILLLTMDGWYLLQSNVIRIERLSLDFFNDPRYKIAA